MKQLYRLLSIILLICIIGTYAVPKPDTGNNRVMYSIQSTMSDGSKISPLSEKIVQTSPSEEPFYKNQWALNNDGTFSVDTDEDIPDYNLPDIINSPKGSGYRNGFGIGYDFRFYFPGFGGFVIPINLFANKSDYFSKLISNQITAVKGIDIDAAKAWDVVGKGKRDVIVAVIDTGVDYTHEDLSGAIWTNEGEKPGDGIDNDKNGYIDDVYGWDFYNNKPYEIKKSSSEYDHATHVAGTIAASVNGKGIAGINTSGQVKIMSIKALGGSEGSGYTASVIDAIKYAEKMGASICNLSFGSSVSDSSMEKAIADSNMLFVCAAGNAQWTFTGTNTDIHPVYPACYNLDNVISVANLTYDGTLDETSDYGPTSVDIAAPGSYIMSTVSGNKYEYMSGTSMAAPMVTAVAAMVYSCKKDVSLAEVKDIILSSAKPLTALKGKVVTGGMLNAYNAVTFK